MNRENPSFHMIITALHQQAFLYIGAFESRKQEFSDEKKDLAQSMGFPGNTTAPF